MPVPNYRPTLLHCCMTGEGKEAVLVHLKSIFCPYLHRIVQEKGRSSNPVGYSIGIDEVIVFTSPIQH